MNRAGNNSALKVITAILLLLLLALSAYTFKFYNTVQDNERDVAREKEVIEMELRDILKKYNKEIANTEVMHFELGQARDRIKNLLDSLVTSASTRDVLLNYRKEILALRKGRDVLLYKADSLALANKALQKESMAINQEKLAVKNAFDQTTEELDSLALQNQELQTELMISAALGMSNLNGKGIIVRRSGKHIPNTRVSRIDNIEICYTLVANSKTKAGYYRIYVQVINPDNNVMGLRDKIDFGQNTLFYSAIEEVDYDQEEMQCCLLIKPMEEKFEKGLYRINVFENDRLVGDARLELE